MPTKRPDTTPWVRRAHVAALVFLMLAGVGLRAHRLSDESVWYDEYSGIARISEPTLAAYLRIQNVENTFMAPFYFVLQYYWAQFTGGSALAARWLSILFGILTIPVLYHLGRELYGRREGLLAALFLTLSPFHIFHSQGLRPYALMTLLALISVYAFAKMLAGEKRGWWGLNLAANGLLMWTHVLAVWLLVTEGLFLLLFRWRHLRKTVVWAALHAVFLAPLAALVLSWQSAPVQGGVLGGLRSILNHLFTRDTERIHWVVNRVLDPRLADLPLPGYVWHLIQTFSATDRALAAALVFGLALGIWRLFRRGSGYACSRNCRAPRLFLCFWFLLPALLLYGFASVFRPELWQERYTIYSSLALYLLVAAGIVGLHTRLARWSLTGLLILLLGAHVLLADALPLRPGFVAAGRHIKERAAADCPVIYYPILTSTTFAYNLDSSTHPIVDTDDVPSVFALLDGILETHEEGWLILAETRSRFDVRPFERYAGLCGFACVGTVFPGPNCLFLYRCVRQSPGTTLGTPEVVAKLRTAVKAEPDDILLRSTLCKALARVGRLEDRTAQLGEILERLPPEPRPGSAIAEALRRTGFLGSLEPDEYVARLASETTRAFCQALVDAGRQEEAIHAYQTGLRRCPDDPQLPLEFVHALLRFGRYDEAHETSLLAIERFPRDYMLRIALGETQECMGRDEEAVTTYRCTIAMDPEKPYAYTQLGLVSLRIMNYGEALEALRTAVDIHAKENDPAQLSREALIRTYCAIEDYAAAWEAVATCREHGIAVPAELLSKLARDSGPEPAAAPD